jgi:hypothetical protein
MCQFQNSVARQDLEGLQKSPTDARNERNSVSRPSSITISAHWGERSSDRNYGDSSSLIVDFLLTGFFLRENRLYGDILMTQISGLSDDSSISPEL